MFLQLLAAILLQSTTTVPSLCQGGGACAPPPATADSPADVEARVNQQKVLEAQFYGPIRFGRTASSCASARQMAISAKRPDMADVIDSLCAVQN